MRLWGATSTVRLPGRLRHASEAAGPGQHDRHARTNVARGRYFEWAATQSVIIFSAAGAMVSSIPSYSAGDPVVASCSR